MQSTKRPKGVWLILVFCSASAIYSLIWIWRIFSKQAPTSSAAAEYLQNPGAINNSLTVLGLILTVAFVVALFKMRRVAAAVFSAIIALTVFSCLWNIIFKNYFSLFSAAPTALVGLLVVVVAALVLFGVIYVYLRALVREGKLT
jgi:hypothetical protein